MRRLGQVIGRCEATTPAPNVAEKKRTKGASPTAFFRSPSRESGEAHTDLLCEAPPHAALSYYADLLYIMFFYQNSCKTLFTIYIWKILFTIYYFISFFQYTIKNRKYANRYRFFIIARYITIIYY